MHQTLHRSIFPCGLKGNAACSTVLTAEMLIERSGQVDFAIKQLGSVKPDTVIDSWHVSDMHCWAYARPVADSNVKLVHILCKVGPVKSFMELQALPANLDHVVYTPTALLAQSFAETRQCCTPEEDQLEIFPMRFMTLVELFIIRLTWQKNLYLKHAEELKNFGSSVNKVLNLH